MKVEYRILIALALSMSLFCCSDDKPSTNNVTNNVTNNSTNNTTNGTLPDDAFSWELPEDATEVPWADFEAKLAAGTHVSVSKEILLEQRAARDAKEAADEQTILDFKALYPDTTVQMPTRADDALPDPDGNHRISWLDKAGTSREVTLLGTFWEKENIAESIRVYPTLENQLDIYTSLYPKLSDDVIGALTLPDPAEIDINPGEFTLEKVSAYVDDISALGSSIVPGLIDPTLPPAARPATCEGEIGAGAGSDRTQTGAMPAADGLFALYSWKTKWLSTCIKNQAVRGSCVAMGSVSAIEQLVADTQNKWVNLSEQWLYHEMKYKWERQDYGDGFYTKGVTSNLKSLAVPIPYEEAWNYNPSWSRVDGVKVCTDVNCGGTTCDSCINNTSYYYYFYSCEDFTQTCGDSTHQSNLVCSQDSVGAYHCAFEELPNLNPQGTGYSSNNYSSLWDHKRPQYSLDRVILNVGLGSPVVMGVPLYPSFWNATANRGFVPMPDLTTEKPVGGHAMHILATVDNGDLPVSNPPFPNGDGGGWLIVKNSWGTGFADAGYVYIPYAYLREFADDAVAFHDLH